MGARSESPIGRKWTTNAAWGQNKNSGPLSKFTSMIETTGISLNHEIVICSASATSNERRRAKPEPSPPAGVIYSLCDRISINSRQRMQRARARVPGTDASHHDHWASDSFLSLLSLSLYFPSYGRIWAWSCSRFIPVKREFFYTTGAQLWVSVEHLDCNTHVEPM